MLTISPNCSGAMQQYSGANSLYLLRDRKSGANHIGGISLLFNGGEQGTRSVMSVDDVRKRDCHALLISKL